MTIYLKTALAMIFSSFILPVSSWACSCAPMAATFFETVAEHNRRIEKGEFPASMALKVVTAEVKEYLQLRPGPLPTEMVLLISDVIQGQVTTKEVVVAGDDGLSCSPYVTQFPIGKRFIFALNSDEKAQHWLSACGVYSKEISTLSK